MMFDVWCFHRPVVILVSIGLNWSLYRPHGEIPASAKASLLKQKPRCPPIFINVLLKSKQTYTCCTMIFWDKILQSSKRAELDLKWNWYMPMSKSSFLSKRTLTASTKVLRLHTCPQKPSSELAHPIKNWTDGSSILARTFWQRIYYTQPFLVVLFRPWRSLWLGLGRISLLNHYVGRWYKPLAKDLSRGRCRTCSDFLMLRILCEEHFIGKQPQQNPSKRYICGFCRSNGLCSWRFCQTNYVKRATAVQSPMKINPTSWNQTYHTSKTVEITPCKPPQCWGEAWRLVAEERLWCLLCVSLSWALLWG